MTDPRKSGDAQPSLWQLSLKAGANAVNAYEEALEPFCDSLSWLTDDDELVWEIQGFSRQKPDAELVDQAVAAVAQAFDEPKPNVALAPVQHRDWVVENLRQFPPIDAGRYFIYGSHFEGTPPPGRTGICLNPGQAFGSGDHATTQGCLLALDNLARNRKFQAMLDMGCGSGILAIAMAHTWAGSMTRLVVASDNDARAIRVAAENSHRNGTGSRVRTNVADGYKSADVIRFGPYDLIVSNILANPLCRMSYDLGRHLRRSEHGGGIVVLSGFLIRDSRRVLAAHQRQGLRLLKWYDIKGWRTLVLQRNGKL